MIQRFVVDTGVREIEIHFAGLILYGSRDLDSPREISLRRYIRPLRENQNALNRKLADIRVRYGRIVPDQLSITRDSQIRTGKVGSYVVTYGVAAGARCRRKITIVLAFELNFFG